jgi:hypothetical protein
MDGLEQIGIFDSRRIRDEIVHQAGVGKSVGGLAWILGLTPCSVPPGRLGTGLPDFPIQDRYGASEHIPPAAVRHRRFQPQSVRPQVVATPAFRERELEWRRTHANELQALQNQWVVLEGDEVIARGENPLEVISEAKSKGVRTPYIFFVEPTADNTVSFGL